MESLKKKIISRSSTLYDELRLEKVIQLNDNKLRVFLSHSKLFLIREKIRVLSSLLFSNYSRELKKDIYRSLKISELSHLLWVINTSYSFYFDFKSTLTIAYFRLKNHYTFIVDIKLIRKYYNIFDFGICKESKSLLKKYIIMCRKATPELTNLIDLSKEQIFIKYCNDNNNWGIRSFSDWKLTDFLNSITRKGSSGESSKLIFTGKYISLKKKTLFWIPTKSELKTIIDKLPYKKKYSSIIEEYENWRKRKKISIKCEELNYLAFLMKKKFKLIWDKHSSYWKKRPIYLKFKINKYLTLKLEAGRINIYVNRKSFGHCMFLIMNIPIHKIKKYDLIDSIDEASEIQDSIDETYEIKKERPDFDDDDVKITKREEFWAHCSNLQAWAENDYDTRILKSNLAFPLLLSLKKAGDPIAKKVFKNEIIERLLRNFKPVSLYLIEQGYLEFFNKDELRILLKDKAIIMKEVKFEIIKILRGYK